MACILQQHLLDHICHLCYRGINASAVGAVDSLEFGVHVVKCADNFFSTVPLRYGSIEDCVADKAILYSKGVKMQLAIIC